MSDRRRSQRFACSSPVEARMHLLDDVLVEKRRPGALTVLSTVTSTRGERLSLRLRTNDGGVASLDVSTTESRPIVAEGRLRYRLELRTVRPEAEGVGAEAGAIAALVRTVPVTIADVSATGCLVQSAAPFTPGIVALLEVPADDRWPVHSEAVRVCHAGERRGTGLPYRTGTAFVVFDAAVPGSLRERSVRAEGAELLKRLVRAGEVSGRAQTKLVAEGLGSMVRDAATAGELAGS